MQHFFVNVAQHKGGELDSVCLTACDAGGHYSWHSPMHDWSAGSPGKLSPHRTNLSSQ